MLLYVMFKNGASSEWRDKTFSQELGVHLRNAHFKSAFKIAGKYFLDKVVNSLV